MRHFDSSVNGPNLINGLDLGAETSVHAEDLAINDGSNREVVEDLSAVFPRIGVTVLPIDLIVKTIDGCDLSAWKGWYLDSWLPLRRVILSGYLTFKQSRYSKVSTEW